MTTGPEGVRAGLEAALAEQPTVGDLVQGGLFEELEPHETGDLSAPSPLSAALTGGKRSKGGRPLGAKSRRTEAVTAWLLSMHRHPVSVLMEAYSMTPAQLAERIGLSKVLMRGKVWRDLDGSGKLAEVEIDIQSDSYSNDVLLDIFKLQVRMAEAVAPYVAQRLPQAVQLEGGASLTVNFGGVNLGPDAGVSVPARGDQAEISTGPGMSVRLGQVGRTQSDADVSDE